MRIIFCFINGFFFAGLPTSFGAKKSTCKKKKKNYSNDRHETVAVRDDDPSMVGNDVVAVDDEWSTYWNTYGQYLTWKTWLTQFGDSMDEQNRRSVDDVVQQFEISTVENVKVLLETINELLKTDDRLETDSWDEVWTHHCEKVYRLCYENFYEIYEEQEKFVYFAAEEEIGEGNRYLRHWYRTIMC